MNKVEFFVPGTPKPAGSKNAFAIRRGGVPTGQVVVTDTAGKAGDDWSKAVALKAREAYKGKPLEGAVICNYWFLMPRPQSHYGSGKNSTVTKPSAPAHHVGKPDAIKLTRRAEDALKGILWADDSQVILSSIGKRYATIDEEPGVLITMFPATETKEEDE